MPKNKDLRAAQRFAVESKKHPAFKATSNPRLDARVNANFALARSVGLNNVNQAYGFKTKPK
jgi:hypothetical protein